MLCKRLETSMKTKFYIRLEVAIFLLMAGLCGTSEAKRCDVAGADSYSARGYDVLSGSEPCEKESFSVFFSRFCADSSFQFSRINFPLRYVYPEQEVYDEPEIVKEIAKEAWTFTNLLGLPKSRITEAAETDGAERRLTFQIEDTGVSVEYIFRLIDCSWHLAEVVDESM